MIDFSSEVITADVNLYSVWVRNVEAVIKLHYDGVKETVNEEEQEKVVEIKDTYLAGDTIDLTTGAFKEYATYKSNKNGITYNQTGWYTGADENQTGKLTSYVIPVPEEKEEEQDEVEVVVVDLYPVWDITVASVTDMNSDTFNVVLNELENLQKSNQGYCGDIAINSKVNVDNNLSIPEGITVTFNDDVTVGASGALIGDVKKGNKDVEIIKSISSSTASSTTTGLNASLNSKMYDKVQLISSISSVNIKVEKDNKAVLDLNNYNITLSNSYTFENNGDLTLINSGAADKKISVQKGITNNGKLTIGEKVTERDVKYVVEIENNAASTTATITNSKDATLTIESGTIKNIATSANENYTNAAVLNEKGGTVVIEGGKIDCTTTGKTAALLNEGTATISGGTFDRSQNSTSVGAGYYVVVNHGELEITGGKFSASTSFPTATAGLIENGYYTSFEGLNKEAILTITGGEFNGGRYIIKNDYAGVATIKGGKYTAVGETSESLNTANKTRSVFKTIGEMTLDFTKATAEDTLIKLGDSGSKTALVLVGDQKKTVEESLTDSVLKNSITVYPFKADLVKIGDKSISDEENAEEAIKQLILVEKGKGKDQLEKADIEIHVGGNGVSAADASKQLMLLMREFVAKEMNKDNAGKTTVKIVLDSNVEILEDEETDPNYEITKENTELDLNGNTLTIHKLYVFEVNTKVTDTSKDQKGKIVLNSEGTQNQNKEIFSNGELLPLDELKAIADKEISVKK